MIGDTGKFWIDTDPYVDVERLRSLHLDLVAATALSVSCPTLYGAGLYEEKDRDLTVAQEMIYDDPNVLTKYNEIIATLQRGINNAHWHNHVLQSFKAMVYGTYSGGWTVSVRAEDNFLNKNIGARCQDTSNARHFTKFLSFVKTLPFAEVGRVQVFVNYPGGRTPIHFDGSTKKKHLNDHLWMRTTTEKKFFIFDGEAREKHYVTGHTAFFNESDYHGTDIAERTVFSLRVDGKFTPEFKKQLGIDHLKSYT